MPAARSIVPAGSLAASTSRFRLVRCFIASMAGTQRRIPRGTAHRAPRFTYRGGWLTRAPMSSNLFAWVQYSHLTVPSRAMVLLGRPHSPHFQNRMTNRMTHSSLLAESRRRAVTH